MSMDLHQWDRYVTIYRKRNGGDKMAQEILWLSLKGKIPCMFQMMTGWYCPGCGGTRAVKALLRGNLLESFCYHPLVLYGAAVSLFFFVSYLFYWKTKNSKYRLYLENGYLYAGLGILLLNFLIKNYVLLVKGIALLDLIPSMF